MRAIKTATMLNVSNAWEFDLASTGTGDTITRTAEAIQLMINLQKPIDRIRHLSDS